MFSYIKTAKLIPLDSNPRTITDSSFKKLCKSLENNKDYFEARPLIVSDRTGKLVVLAGNQRLKAAIKLRMDKVPCFVMSGLNEEKEKEIIIRDNVSSGNWDMDILANEFEFSDLVDWDVPIGKDWDMDHSGGESSESGSNNSFELPTIKVEIIFENPDDFQDARQKILDLVEGYHGCKVMM